METRFGHDSLPESKFHCILQKGGHGGQFLEAVFRAGGVDPLDHHRVQHHRIDRKKQPRNPAGVIGIVGRTSDILVLALAEQGEGPRIEQLRNGRDFRYGHWCVGRAVEEARPVRNIEDGSIGQRAADSHSRMMSDHGQVDPEIDFRQQGGGKKAFPGLLGVLLHGSPEQFPPEWGSKLAGQRTFVVPSLRPQVFPVEVDRLVRDAESHAEEDKRKRERIEARNQADSLVYQTEKTLQDHGDNVDPAVRSEIEGAVADLKKAMEGDDVEEIKAKTEALTQASHKLAQAMYGQSAGEQEGYAQGGPRDYGQTGGQGASQGKADEDVVDAEYENVA